jgi:hypothetical protein
VAETKATDKIDLDRIATMFKLPHVDDVLENNVEYISEAGAAGRREAERDEDATEADIEKAGEEAEQAAQDEIFGNYHNAATHVADELFGVHHLELIPLGKKQRYPFEFRIQPVSGKTWKDAARQLAETINGVGLTSEDPSEYAKAPKSYVLSRLGWIRSHPEVYGGPSPARMFEHSWR